MQDEVRQMTMMAVIASTAPLLPVAFLKTARNGYPVGVLKISLMSPSVNMIVTPIRKASVKLGPTAHMIAFGRTMPASLISSDMWTEQSKPMSELRGVMRPIIADTPVVGQPPLLLNVKRTSEALARGAMIQSGMMMAKRPQK